MPSVTTSNIFETFLARNFQKGVTLGQSEGTHQIAMPFAPPVVGCLLKKGLQKGSHEHLRTPLATPLLLTEKCYLYFLAREWLGERGVDIVTQRVVSVTT